MVRLGTPGASLKREANAREKIFFLIILAVTLFLFLDNLWQPQAKKIRVMKEDLKRVEQQVEAVKKMIEVAKEQLFKGVEDVKLGPEQDSYVKRVLNRRVVDLVEEANSTAALLGDRKFAGKARVQKVEIGDKKDEERYATVPLIVELRGSFSAIRDYLKSVENIGRPLIVESFSIIKKGGAGDSLQMGIRTRLYIPKA